MTYLPGLFAASCLLAGLLLTYPGSAFPLGTPTAHRQQQATVPQAGASSGARVVRGLSTPGDYSLYGSASNNLVIDGAEIGGILKIDGVSNVTVTHSRLGGIWFRDTQRSANVLIEHNEIAGAPNDCVQVHDGPGLPQGVILRNNKIHDCGLAHPNSDLFHGIYDQVPGVRIEGNCLFSARAAISVRADAVVQGNRIRQIPSGGGIEYFSDHNSAEGGALVIEDNVIASSLQNDLAGAGSNRGLVVIGNDIGSRRHMVATVEIRNNRLVVLNNQNDSRGGKFFDVYIQQGAPPVAISGNTLVNLIGADQFVGPYAGTAETEDVKTRDAKTGASIQAVDMQCAW